MKLGQAKDDQLNLAVEAYFKWPVDENSFVKDRTSFAVELTSPVGTSTVVIISIALVILVALVYLQMCEKKGHPFKIKRNQKMHFSFHSNDSISTKMSSESGTTADIGNKTFSSPAIISRQLSPKIEGCEVIKIGKTKMRQSSMHIEEGSCGISVHMDGTTQASNCASRFSDHSDRYSVNHTNEKLSQIVANGSDFSTCVNGIGPSIDKHVSGQTEDYSPSQKNDVFVLPKIIENDSLTWGHKEDTSFKLKTVLNTSEKPSEHSTNNHMSFLTRDLTKTNDPLPIHWDSAMNSISVLTDDQISCLEADDINSSINTSMCVLPEGQNNTTDMDEQKLTHRDINIKNSDCSFGSSVSDIMDRVKKGRKKPSVTYERFAKKENKTMPSQTRKSVNFAMEQRCQSHESMSSPRASRSASMQNEECMRSSLLSRSMCMENKERWKENKSMSSQTHKSVNFASDKRRSNYESASSPHFSCSVPFSREESARSCRVDMNETDVDLNPLTRSAFMFESKGCAGLEDTINKSHCNMIDDTFNGSFQSNSFFNGRCSNDVHTDYKSENRLQTQYYSCCMVSDLKELM
mmetsp:Transcript_37/g.81  ORF Transcript_37/g.81 Transcript_37/m.81 type:complete len:577 (-) Transcript_37:38-1768(-)